MTVATAVGSTLSISTATSTAANQGAFEAETYLEVEQLESIGDFGDTTNPVKLAALVA